MFSLFYRGLNPRLTFCLLEELNHKTNQSRDSGDQWFSRQLTKDKWPDNMPLAVQPTMKELTGVILSLADGKAVGPDKASVDLFKITLNGDPALRRRLLDTAVCIWTGGEVPQKWKYATIMILH